MPDVKRYSINCPGSLQQSRAEDLPGLTDCMREHTDITGTVAGPTPMVIPTLDDLTRDVTKAFGLPLAILASLQAKVATVQGALAAAMASAAGEIGVGGSDPEKWMDDAAIAALLHVEHSWLVRHRNKLPFAKRLSRKRWLYSESGARRWLASRKAA